MAFPFDFKMKEKCCLWGQLPLSPVAELGDGRVRELQR